MTYLIKNLPALVRAAILNDDNQGGMATVLGITEVDVSKILSGTSKGHKVCEEAVRAFIDESRYVEEIFDHKSYGVVVNISNPREVETQIDWLLVLREHKKGTNAEWSILRTLAKLYRGLGSTYVLVETSEDGKEKYKLTLDREYLEAAIKIDQSLGKLECIPARLKEIAKIISRANVLASRWRLAGESEKLGAVIDDYQSLIDDIRIMLETPTRRRELSMPLNAILLASHASLVEMNLQRDDFKKANCAFLAMSDDYPNASGSMLKVYIRCGRWHHNKELVSDLGSASH